MSEKTIGQHKGNDKLGKKISTFSRSYDLSCPNSCEHIDNGCYAERIERLFPTAKKSYNNNLQIKDWQKIRSFLLEAKRKNNDVRYHVSGDFLFTTKNDKKVLDKKYIAAIKQANQSIIDDGNIPPKQFCFTHVHHPLVASLSKYIKIYASIETAGDHKKAKDAGFELFAWSSNLKKGKDKQKIWISETGKKIVTCFEQLGSKKDCGSCRFCIEPHIKLDVAFMRH